jgi:hypothetical protein
VLPLPLIAVALVLGLWWLTRARELFRLSVRGGRVLVVGGRIPPGLLSDIEDMVRRPPVGRATIVARAEEHGARIFASGLDEGREQRLRNIFALYPASRLRQAPAIRRPTLGQLLGIAWLAWLLDRR